MIAVLRHERGIGLASRHPDDGARLVAVNQGVRKMWASIGASIPPPRSILVQGALKGAHQHVALNAVVEGYPKPGIGTALVVQRDLSHLRNIRHLPTDDEEAALFDLCLYFKGTCFPKARMHPDARTSPERQERASTASALKRHWFRPGSWFQSKLGGSGIRSRSGNSSSIPLMAANR